MLCEFAHVCKFVEMEIWLWSTISYKQVHLTFFNIWKLEKHDGDLQLHSTFYLGHDSPMVDVVTNQIFNRCNHWCYAY